MNDSKRLIGLGTLAFCFAMWFWIIPAQTENRLAAEFPRLIILFLAVPALIMLARPARPKTAQKVDPAQKKALLRSFLLLAAVGAYMALVPVAGFYVCSTVALAVFLYCLGERKWQGLFLMPLCVMLFLYLALNKGLAYQMPVGWFL